MNTPEPIPLDSRPFFGTEEHTHHELKTEQPHHRAILAFLAQGFSPKEVSEMTGWSNTMIQYTWKQPWAQAIIAELQSGAAKKAVDNVLNGVALEAAKLIAKSIKLGHEVADGGDGVSGHRLSDSTKDAHKLLDRLYGTAPQTVLHLNAEDMEQLSTEELERIAKGAKN